MPSTTYDVNVHYRLTDKASKGVGMIGREARKASRGIGILSGGMRMLQTAAIGFFGFRAAKSALIDFNVEMEQARITMGGLLMMNMGGEWAENQKRANKLVKQFQHDAKASVATTKDFVQFAQLITGPMTRAGAGMEQIREVTKGGVIAAKAFGIAGEVAARDIEQALAGTLTQKDRFARALLEPMGLTTKKWNAMVRTTPGLAADALVKAFNQPAIAAMAKAQENSWAGIMSTFTDNFQRFMGSVGLPLMKALTNEVKGWNDWISKNQKQVKEWATTFAGGLVKGFKAVKSAIGFLVDNRHTLLAIAKAWLAIKIGGGITGMIMGGAGILGGKGGFLSNLSGANGKLKLFASAIGLGAAAVGLLVIGANAFADWVDRQQSKKLADITKGTLDNKFLQDIIGADYGGYKGSLGALNDPKMMTGAEQANARFLASEFRRMGIVGKDDKINKDKFAKLMGLGEGKFAGAMLDTKEGQAIMKKVGMIIESADLNSFRDSVRLMSMIIDKDFKNRLTANRSIIGAMGSYFTDAPNVLARGYNAIFGGGVDDRKKPGNKQTINVKANIEVVGDDPDRIAMGLVGAFQDIAANPTQSRRTLPGLREGR